MKTANSLTLLPFYNHRNDWNQILPVESVFEPEIRIFFHSSTSSFPIVSVPETLVTVS